MIIKKNIRIIFLVVIKSRKHRTCFWMLIAALYLLLFAGNSRYIFADYEGDKWVTWRILSSTNLSGSYKTNAKANAKCDHGFPASVEMKTGSWLLADGFAGGGIGSWVTASSGNLGHPYGYSNSDFDAVAQAQNIVNTHADIWGGSDIIKCENGPWSSSASSSVEVAIPSGRALNYNVVSAPRALKIKDIWNIKQPLSFTGSESSTSKTVIKDPLIVTLLEIETGRTIVEELFSMKAERNMDASLRIDDGGIFLEAAADGISSAWISAGFSSSWITNASDPWSASLTNGFFQTSGFLSGQPWDLTFDGGNVIRAFLPIQYLNVFEGQYQVPGSFLVNDLHYDESLNFSLSGDDRAADAVPETRTFTLLLIGIGFLFIGAKRIRKT